MNRIIRPRVFSGKDSQEPWDWEQAHAAISQRAAEEGIVLLKNDGVLPLPKGSSIALFGGGATRTVKGGTGSGDVNERRSVSIAEGMRAAGFVLTSGEWLSCYEKLYLQARMDWRDGILAKSSQSTKDSLFSFFDAYSTTPFRAPAGPDVFATGTDTAIYVISRVAGEGSDRTSGEGNYCLSGEEEKQLADLCGLYRSVIVIVNAGGVIDLSFMDRYANIGALLIVSQPGMAGGHAVAAVLDGDVNPSGHLTDTWAFRYSDYPTSATFSHNNGNVRKEYYHEGIFVGYRYFDTFGVPVRYGFGEGLSYTSFEVKAVSCEQASDKVTAAIRVTNTGKTAGKDVVQLYVQLPQGRLVKERRRLVAFAKTKLLAPGESQVLELTFGAAELVSYDEKNAAWVIEPGCYGLYVGESLNGSRPIAAMRVQTEITVRRVRNISPLQEELEEIRPDEAKAEAWARAFAEEAADLPVFDYDAETLAPADYAEPEVDAEALAVAEMLPVEELIALVTGEPSRGQGSALGSAGISVPGSAAETSDAAEHAGVAPMVLADGPAGLRLNQKYYVKDGQIVSLPFQASLENGFFMEDQPEGDIRYQYCTAIPVGTMLAQTWNTELVAACGDAVGHEMQTYGVTLWLAPGMNIHRDPLCGRNFEYYSEDPLVSGKIAAAMTDGVQRNRGCGTTIKHFACNNQEDNRMGSDSIVSERVLREIYLRGFGIAIRDSQPLSIMTSYNLINGVHSANNRELCTDYARCECGFRGVIMTDWTTTNQGDPLSTASGCIRAGNDLVMPGTFEDHDDIRAALADGSLTMDQLKRCAARVIRTAFLADRYL